jgi:hypothetical protein
MSLGIAIRAPEGIVLAAESRVTLTAELPEAPPIHVNFDNATKLLSFSPPNNAVGVVTYGQAAIGLRTAHSFVPEFEATLPDERLPVAAFGERLRDFFSEQWAGTSRGVDAVPKKLSSQARGRSPSRANFPRVAVASRVARHRLAGSEHGGESPRTRNSLQFVRSAVLENEG